MWRVLCVLFFHMQLLFGMSEQDKKNEVPAALKYVCQNNVEPNDDAMIAQLPEPNDLDRLKELELKVHLLEMEIQKANRQLYALVNSTDKGYK